MKEEKTIEQLEGMGYVRVSKAKESIGVDARQIQALIQRLLSRDDLDSEKDYGVYNLGLGKKRPLYVVNLEKFLPHFCAHNLQEEALKEIAQ